MHKLVNQKWHDKWCYDHMMLWYGDHMVVTSVSHTMDTGGDYGYEMSENLR